jgi:hypothetical protein
MGNFFNSQVVDSPITETVDYATKSDYFLDLLKSHPKQMLFNLQNKLSLKTHEIIIGPSTIKLSKSSVFYLHFEFNNCCSAYLECDKSVVENIDYFVLERMGQIIDRFYLNGPNRTLLNDVLSKYIETKKDNNTRVLIPILLGTLTNSSIIIDKEPIIYKNKITVYMKNNLSTDALNINLIAEQFNAYEAITKLNLPNDKLRLTQIIHQTQFCGSESLAGNGFNKPFVAGLNFNHPVFDIWCKFSEPEIIQHIESIELIADETETCKPSISNDGTYYKFNFANNLLDPGFNHYINASRINCLKLKVHFKDNGFIASDNSFIDIFCVNYQAFKQFDEMVGLMWTK